MATKSRNFTIILSVQTKEHAHMHTHVHTYIHVHTHVHTYIHTFIHTYTRTHVHTYVLAYLLTDNMITYFILLHACMTQGNHGNQKVGGGMEEGGDGREGRGG